MITRNHAGRGCPAPITLATMITALALLAGCATQREPSSQLQSARSAYQEVDQVPEAKHSAAEALDRAQRELDRAEALLADGEDMVLVNHHAYLAERYARIAESQAENAELQKQIDEARERRKQLRQKVEQLQAQQARNTQAELRSKLSDLQAKQTERGVVLTLGDVLFGFDKATLKPGGERAAKRLADFLQEYPERRIRVEGYTDSMGPEAYNEKLSMRRAESVKQAIVQHDVAPSRIVTKGYGESYPIASNDNPAGRQRNRRVEVLISDQEGQLQGRQ